MPKEIAKPVVRRPTEYVDPNTDPSVPLVDQEPISQILSLFKAPPRLNFGTASRQSLNLIFPRLNEDAKTKPNHTYGIFEDLFEFATRKHRFDQPDHDDWSTFVQFPNARLVRRRDGNYVIQEGAPKLSDRSVNPSRKHCDTWFTEKMLASIVRARAATATFVTGQPGSGKSTLFKGLLNRHRTLLKDSNIIATRFESLKFDSYRKSWGARLPLSTVLKDYIERLLLRDIVYYLGYNHSADGQATRTQAGQLSDNRIQALLDEESIAPESVRQDDAFLIRESMHRHDVDVQKLWKIDGKNREALVTYFAKHFKFCIVFDGLDYFTLAHRRFDEDGYLALQTLIESFVLHGAQNPVRDGVALPFDVHSIFVLRESTYSTLVTDRLNPIRLAEISKWEVAPVIPRVALFNAIRRGVTQISRARGGAASPFDAEVAQRLMAAVDGLILFVNRELGLAGGKSRDFFELFHGDMRQCYSFIGRVLSWIVKLERKRLLDEDRKLSLREAANILSEETLIKTLRQRGYRLVEFLLCSEGWHYENSVFFIQGDAGDILAGRPSGKLQINSTSDACLDNIFNYHVSSHPSHLDAHCLLEKLRILQIIDRSPPAAGARKIRAQCLTTLGYEIGSEEHLASTLAILLHAGYIDVRSTPAELLFSTSRKGKFLMERLLRQQVYLEHVFHQTLFPERLIKNVNDTPRHKDWESWTVASIINCFILLVYIKNVEENPASGIHPPKEVRITERMQESLIGSISKILRQNAKELKADRSTIVKESARPEVGSFAIKAFEKLQILMEEWRSGGMIEEHKGWPVTFSQA